MNIKYFNDTDTLLITLLSNEPVETQDLDENTLLDIDKQGNVCSITIEHASERIRDTNPNYERIASSSKSLAVA